MSSDSGLYLRTSIVPSPANPLKNHTVMNSGDVKTMNGGLVDVNATQFPESLREMMGNITVAPTLFARDFLNFNSVLVRNKLLNVRNLRFFSWKILLTQ